MLMQQFNLTRRVITRLVKDISEDELDIQLPELNNTLRWHIGHIIVIPEHFMYHYPEDSEAVPASWNNLFAAETSPKEWTVTPPSYDVLLEELEKQTERFNEYMTDDYFNTPLKEKLPFGRFKTYGDLFVYMIHHEAEHVGQMKTMRQMIKNRHKVNEL